MNLQEYQERLKILLDQEVITTKSHNVGLLAFEELLKILDTTEVDQAEMLFTHLPMALTRISNGIDAEGPAQEIMAEIKASGFFTIAKNQVDLIEENYGQVLPEGEKDYLYMHYTTVLNLNKRG